MCFLIIILQVFLKRWFKNEVYIVRKPPIIVIFDSNINSQFEIMGKKLKKLNKIHKLFRIFLTEITNWVLGKLDTCWFAHLFGLINSYT